MCISKYYHSVVKCIHLSRLTNMFLFSQNKQPNHCLSGKTTVPYQHKISVKAKFMVHFPVLLNKSEVKDTFSGLYHSLPMSSMILFR